MKTEYGKNKLLWLDDLRNPYLNEEGKVPVENLIIDWVLNYSQFTQWIEKYGLPRAISFDHDLAQEHYTPEYFWNDYQESKKFQDWKSKSYIEKTGADCAKWLVDYCLDKGLHLPKINVHSANPIGADYIFIEINKIIK